MFYTAHTEGEASAAEGEARYQASKGVAAEYLSGAACRKLEPALQEDVIGAIYKADGRYVEARDYTATAVAAARAKGISVREGFPVTGLVWEGDRVTGVRSDTEVIAAGVVINAAGAWAGGIDPRLTHPVRPLHGQIMSVEAPPQGLLHNVSRVGAHGYVTPRPNGSVLVGATEDDWGFGKKITPDGMALLSHIASSLLPQLADSAVLDIWTGLRPVTPDGLPAIGPDPRTSGGFLWAAGHSTTGMLQAPATATVLADLVTGRTPGIAIDQVRIDRFLS
jgi:glycine oxidase